MSRRRPHRAAGFAGAAAVSAGGMAGPGVVGPGGWRPGVSAYSTAQPVCRLIVGPPPEGRRGEDFPAEEEGCGHSRPGPSSPSTPVLTFRRLTGTEEISRLHAWEVDVVAPAPALDPPRWLGRHGTVVMRLDDEAVFEDPGCLPRRGVDGGESPSSASLRYLDGLITRVGMREGPVELPSPSAAASASPPIALFPHRLLLRPWLWLATQRSHVRVFEGLAVPAILAQVLAPYGHPLSLDRLTRPHPARPHTPQCGETDFDFIARLCEDEGIYWFFEHQAGGHGLVFADGGAGASRSSGGVDWVIPFLGPRPPQPGSQAQAGSVRFGRSPVKPPHVDYWAMGREAAVADALPGGLGTARFNAHLNHRGVAPGRTMALRGHPQADPNEAHLVVAVDYHLEEAPGWDGAQLAGGKPAGTPGHAAAVADASSVQRFAMEVHPLCVPFQPEPQAVRPVVRGPQVGSVVAVEAGAVSRVKVRWRLAAWEPEADGLVTDWIPVGPAMGCRCVGGEGCRCLSCAPWGVGEAVLLDFVDGDPERPVCQGRWGGAQLIGASVVCQQGFDRLSLNGGGGSIRRKGRSV